MDKSVNRLIDLSGNIVIFHARVLEIGKNVVPGEYQRGFAAGSKKNNQFGSYFDGSITIAVSPCWVAKLNHISK